MSGLALPSETIFYLIETTIRTYRRFAQQEIHSQIDGLTIDQGMALIYIDRYPDLNQNELADLLFRDKASLTRMIKSMEKSGFIRREINPADLRRYRIVVSENGKKALKNLPDIIGANRKKALEGITKEEEQELRRILEKIVANCKKKEE